MAKAVLISIRPEWVKKILDGEKTLTPELVLRGGIEMSDYISREAAIEKIRVTAGCAECAGSNSALCDCNVCDVYNAIRLIKSLPAADVERQGRWEKYYHSRYCGIDADGEPIYRQ